MSIPNMVLVRLEAVKAAAKVASPSDGIGNLLIHARWLAGYISTGEPPEIASGGSGV